MKPLTKEEFFVCEMIWGCVPLDINFVRNSKLFQEGMKDFENGKWKEYFEYHQQLQTKIKSA